MRPESGKAESTGREIREFTLLLGVTENGLDLGEGIWQIWFAWTLITQGSFQGKARRPGRPGRIFVAGEEDCWGLSPWEGEDASVTEQTQFPAALGQHPVRQIWAGDLFRQRRKWNFQSESFQGSPRWNPEVLWAQSGVGEMGGEWGRDDNPVITCRHKPSDHMVMKGGAVSAVMEVQSGEEQQLTSTSHLNLKKWTFCDCWESLKKACHHSKVPLSGSRVSAVPDEKLLADC